MGASLGERRGASGAGLRLAQGGLQLPCCVISRRSHLGLQRTGNGGSQWHGHTRAKAGARQRRNRRQQAPTPVSHLASSSQAVCRWRLRHGGSVDGISGDRIIIDLTRSTVSMMCTIEPAESMASMSGCNKARQQRGRAEAAAAEGWVDRGNAWLGAEPGMWLAHVAAERRGGPPTILLSWDPTLQCAPSTHVHPPSHPPG